MASLIDDFIFTLEQQAEYYKNLLGLSLEEKDVLIQNDAEYLQKIIGLQNTLLSRNQRLDRKRESIISDIALVLNKKPENLTFDALVEMYEGKPEQERLKNVRANIRSSLDQLKTVNEQNNQLIQNSLDYIEFTTNIMRDAMAPEPEFYGADGEQITNGGMNFFDAKQ